MKKFIKNMYPYVVIVVFVVLFRTFIATPVRVSGESMVSTLEDGDILILNKLDNSYKRFDIVVIDKDNTRLVKRIIALPGESIEYKNNDLYINGKKIKDIETSRTNDFTLKEIQNVEKIPDDYYFVMGDNRGNSLDSRDYRVGLISKDEIIGTSSIRLFPFNKIGKVQ